MPTAIHPVFFPSVGMQILSALIIFIGLTVITHCISRRVQHEDLSYHGIVTMPWPRLAVLLMFCQSWLFLLASGILVFGVGLEYSSVVCTVSIYLCILLYTTSKLFVYAFLTEKVHIVWSPTVGVRRLESPVYLTCLVSVSLYCIVMTLMLGGPIHENNEEGACVIGLKPLASIPLLVYDLYINLFLTFMFLFPLFRSKLMGPGIRRLAIRTLVAAIVALSTSTVNIVVLIILKGRELGWVNLGACGADIIVNAAAIFWVSGNKSSQQHASSGGTPAVERGGGRRNMQNHLTSNNVDTSQISRNVDSTDFSTKQPYPPDLPAGDNLQVSFPRYNFDSEGSEDGRDGRKPWFVRMFAKNNRLAQEPQHLKIAVTTVNEFDHQHSQIELQTRPDSKSDLEVQKLPVYPGTIAPQQRV